MNILQVISSSRTSGAERHIVTLARALQTLGHKVTVVCPPGNWLPDQLRAAGLPYNEIPMHGLRAPRAIVEIRNMAAALNIDVIHTHLTRATYMGYAAARLSNCPVVSTVHVWTRDAAYRWLPRRNHSFVAVSEYVRDTLIARGVAPHRVHTVYNGTDIVRDNVQPASGLTVRAELSLPATARLVGQFGRVDSFKGAPILVKAARAVVSRHPGTYFVFVGSVEPAIQQELWEMACRYNVEEHFRFTGVRNDVPQLMGAMEVIALPSRTETLGMAIIEAMAMGKPVVATRIGGIVEVIEDESTGVLIDRTPEDLSAAINRLLDSPNRGSAMGEAGRARAVSIFSARTMALNMERLYEQVLSPVPA